MKRTASQNAGEIVVQTRRSSRRAEDRVSVNALTVPDLWNGFAALKGIAAKIRHENQSGNIVIEDRAKILERFADLAEQTWDLAHDMRHCLQETVQPAVKETLDYLRELAGKRGPIGPSHVREAIKRLEQTLRDGQRNESS